MKVFWWTEAGFYWMQSYLSWRWHLLCISFLISFWCCGHVWFSSWDKGKRITHLPLSESMGSSGTQKCSTPNHPPIPLELHEGDGSAKEGGIRTWSCRMQHSSCSLGAGADKTVFYHFEAPESGCNRTKATQETGIRLVYDMVMQTSFSQMIKPSIFVLIQDIIYINFFFGKSHLFENILI